MIWCSWNHDSRGNPEDTSLVWQCQGLHRDQKSAVVAVKATYEVVHISTPASVARTVLSLLFANTLGFTGFYGVNECKPE